LGFLGRAGVRFAGLDWLNCDFAHRCGWDDRNSDQPGSSKESGVETQQGDNLKEGRDHWTSSAFFPG
jgi:hypothetical protein